MTILRSIFMFTANIQRDGFCLPNYHVIPSHWYISRLLKAQWKTKNHPQNRQVMHEAHGFPKVVDDLCIWSLAICEHKMLTKVHWTHTNTDTCARSILQVSKAATHGNPLSIMQFHQLYCLWWYLYINSWSYHHMCYMHIYRVGYEWISNWANWRSDLLDMGD